MMEAKEKRAAKARKEIEGFDIFFLRKLEKYVFGAFINKLRECCGDKGKIASSEPILLKLCGSLTDVRMMLEIACEKLSLELLYADENCTPLKLLKDVLDSNKTCLIHVQDNASLKYLNCLLETFYSSESHVFAVITIRSNDSSIIRLDPNLAATVSTDSVIFDNPEPLLKQILLKLAVDYTFKRGLFLSGELLKHLSDSFLLEKQSYLELKNIVGMSIAKYAMGSRKFKMPITRKGILLPVFKKYCLALNVFSLFWNQLKIEKDILSLHIEIQLGKFEKLFENAKSGWKNVRKDGWTKFVEDAINKVNDFKKMDNYEIESQELLSELKDFEKLVIISEIKTLDDAVKKGLNMSPSRRPVLAVNSQPRDNLLKTLHEIFRDLKPIDVHTLQVARPVQFKSK